MLETQALTIDAYGRVLPEGVRAPAHYQTRRYFEIAHHPDDRDQVYRRTVRYLAPCPDLTEQEFLHAVEVRVKALEGNPCAGLLRAGAQPFLLPKGCLDAEAPMQLQRLLDALSASYVNAMPEHRFVDHVIDEWKLAFRRGADPRLEALRERVSLRTQVGLFLPCLSEYSVLAALEVGQRLPDGLALAGCFELAAVLIGCPGYLSNAERYAPLLWACGDMQASDEGGFHFEAYGGDLTFNRRNHLGQVSEYWWSGLVCFDA